MILEIVSIVISVTAVIFTYIGLERVQEHNRKSVEPYLTADCIWDFKDTECVITISNKGLGTALIKDFQIYIDDQKVKGNRLNNLANALMKKMQGTNAENLESLNRQNEYYKLQKGDALRVGEDRRFLKINLDVDSNELQEILKDFRIECYYTSIYEDKKKDLKFYVF